MSDVSASALRAKIANAIWEEARMIGSTLSGKAADLLADAVIRQLKADYILVPKRHTVARWIPEGIFE